MRNHSHGNNNQIGLGLSCFALGAALGACVAALSTPYSGKRTRRMLARRAEDAQDRAYDTGRDWVDRGREMYNRGAKSVGHAIGR